MKEYYISGDRVIFFCSDSSRVKTHRKRWSSLWVKHAGQRLPFRVKNYYGPTQFYGGILSHRRRCETGKLVVSRGVWRNNFLA